MALTRRTDAEIEMDVKDALYADARLDAQHLEVNVRRGVVHLRGSVPSAAMRGIARRDVERIKGVRDVVNNLVVEPLLPRTDADITADVVTGLVLDSLVDADKIDVETEEGIVYLRGVVDTHTERKAAEDIARGVRGVVDVVNEIQVLHTVQRSDEEIAAEAKRLLTDTLRLNGHHIEVQVHDGVATLRGTVRTPAQYWLADELVRWVPGVEDAINELRVPT